jgi:hypothetical protein
MLTISLDTLRRLFGVGRGVRHSRSFSVTRPAERVAGADLIYRLKAWPQLPESGRTAEIYRMLSVMSQRPVNRQWILSCTRMEPQQLEALLHHLVREGALEVIDPARYAGNTVCG